jgi:signal peptidase II
LHTHHIPRRTAAAIGFAALFTALLLDQLHKYWMLEIYRIEERVRVAITSFFDLTLVWNKGISYGLLQQDGATGRYLLIGFALTAVTVLLIWMINAGSRLSAFSIGLILGGALGNVTDRVFREKHAVADFFSFHYGDFYWYIFNVADVAIAVGTIGLIVDWLATPHDNPTRAE